MTETIESMIEMNANMTEMTQGMNRKTENQLAIIENQTQATEISRAEEALNTTKAMRVEVRGKHQN